MIKVGMISLGCAKNQVDAEVMLATLRDGGCQIADDLEKAEVVIVNTCGFIDEAKQEAIDNILEVCQLKEEGKLRGVVVSGCLAQRFKEELGKEIKGIDALVGVASKNRILEAVQAAYEGRAFVDFAPLETLRDGGKRIQSTPFYYAYLKIAEGCNNRCAYCVIPSLRGDYRSRPMEELLEEARWLAEGGVEELVVIAQDITRYGTDFNGERQLPALLRELCKIEKLSWIRLLYLYPDEITEELIDLIAQEKKIVNYIDLPLQHASDRMLQAMNRRGSNAYLRELIAKIRAKIPDMILRTTFITGFPGETQEDFDCLYDFVKEMHFDRVGAFAYSQEEGTAAAGMEHQIDEDVKEHRRERLMELAARETDKRNQALLGQTVTVLVEGYDKLAECFFGRTWADAPEVDGKVFFTARTKQREGSFVSVLVTQVVDYDLFGQLAEEASTAKQERDGLEDDNCK